MPQPPREFARRSRAPTAAAAPARRSGGGGFARMFGLDPTDRSGERIIVPTSIRGVALAGVGVFLLQFAILLGRRMGNGIAGTTAASDAAAMFVAPPSGFVEGLMAFTFTLAIGGLQLAALYSLIAHAVLRWLRMTSLLAYALGGAGAVYLFLAWWALNGDHLRETCLIELAGGVVAGGLYRVGAGLTSVERFGAGAAIADEGA